MKNILKAILRVSNRELHRIASGRTYWLSLLVFPLITILFFATLFSQGVPTKMPIAIVDQDHTALSRKYSRAIDVTQLSEVTQYPASAADAMSQLRSGKIYGFVVLPSNMQSDVISGRQPRISFYYHNSLLIAGGLMQNDLMVILNTLSVGTNLQKHLAMGQTEMASMAEIQPIQVQTHQLFNPTSSYMIYVVTIVLPIMMQLFILMITIYAIGIEIKDKSSRIWYRKADKSILAAITGKLLPYTLIFMILMMFQNMVLYRIVQVPMNTGMGWMILGSLLFVLSYQAIGILVIGLLPVMRHALNLGAFYGILALTLCGFSFPVESMPPVFRLWAEAFPVRHFMHIFQGQILAGFEPRYVFPSYIALLIFLILPFIVLPRLKGAVIYQQFTEDIREKQPASTNLSIPTEAS